MNYSLFAILGLMLLLNQCKPDDITPTEPTFGEAFVLEQGEEVKVSGEGAETLTLELHSLNDSRCPEDVVCVWMGNAAVTLQASKTGAGSKQLQFCIGDCRPDPVRSKHTVRAEVGQQTYDITLLEVLPYPNSQSTEKAKQVRVLVELAG